jgi:hypothetical protein
MKGAQSSGSSCDWQRAFSVFIAADSIIGPLYVIAGRTIGAGSAIYLMWGLPR